MAKTGNPFFDADFGNFDYAAFMNPKTFLDQMEALDVGKFGESFKLPGVDSEALAQSQRKNIDAFVAANRVAFEGMQAVMQRQSEIVRQAMGEATKAVNELSTADSMESRIAKQTEIVKDVLEQYVASTKELAEMSAKANNEAIDVLNTRWSEGLEEVNSQIKQTVKNKK